MRWTQLKVLPGPRKFTHGDGKVWLEVRKRDEKLNLNLSFLRREELKKSLEI